MEFIFVSYSLNICKDLLYIYKWERVKMMNIAACIQHCHYMMLVSLFAVRTCHGNGCSEIVPWLSSDHRSMDRQWFLLWLWYGAFDGQGSEENKEGNGKPDLIFKSFEWLSKLRSWHSCSFARIFISLLFQGTEFISCIICRIVSSTAICL